MKNIYTREIEGITFECWLDNNAESYHIFTNDYDVWYTDDTEHYSVIIDFHMGYDEVVYTITIKFDGICDTFFVKETIAECVARGMVKARKQCLFAYEWHTIVEWCNNLINVLIGK